MLKITATIVNESRNLIGFMLTGKAIEFGGVSDEVVSQPMSIQALAAKKFVNNQVSFMNNRVTERGGFRLVDLPMKMLMGDSKSSNIVDTPNSIKLVHRYLKDNEPVGFGVQFGDSPKEEKFTYKNLLQLSRWFKPENYVIRRSEKQKEFIAGKPNMLRIDELPTTEIGAPRTAKKTKSGAKEYAKPIENNLIPDKDILSLYEVIRGCDGVIIKLPDEKYKSAGQRDKAVAEEFKPLGIGEIGSPYLQFGDSKLNANTNFKKVGTVDVDFPSGKTPVYTFTYSTKSIFLNGENYIKRFAVAVPSDTANLIISSFGDTLSVKEIKDTMITQPVASLVGKSNLTFFEIDTSKLALIAPSKVKGFILTPKEIRDLVISAFEPKLLTKYLSPRTGLLAALKKTVGADVMNADKKLAGMFAGMNQEYLKKLDESGIDVYTGAFKRTVGVPKSTSAGGDSDSKSKEDSAVTIDYAVAGKNAAKITYKLICEYASKEDDSKIPASLIGFIKSFERVPNDADKVAQAQKYLDEAEKKLEDIKRKLWLHKCAMYIASNKSGIHSHDKKNWELNTGKRTKAKVYNCKAAGCEDLAVACLNIDIV